MEKKELRQVVAKWTKANEAKNKAEREIEECETAMKQHIKDNGGSVGVLADKVLAYHQKDRDQLVPKSDKLEETHCLADLMKELENTEFVKKALDKTAICKAESTPSVKKALKKAQLKVLVGENKVRFKTVK